MENDETTTNGPQPQIDFLYWEECQSHERALEILRETMSEERVEAPVRIRRVDTEEEARKLSFPGSPTIRIDGRDVDEAGNESLLPSSRLTCRTYINEAGRASPLPPRQKIIRALRQATRKVA